MKTEKSTMREKLQGYMEKLTVDPFGIEAQINENITRFFEDQAARTDATHDDHFLVIKKQEQLKSWMVEKRKVLPLSVNTLVTCFAGSFYTPSLETRMIKGIADYINLFSAQNDVPEDQLKFIISLERSTPVLHAFHGDSLIRRVALQELIKHLK
ncbi:hypothetical protein JMN32_08820 [Fulvivirga sp. 29W222]|uniref:Uncharacterized protein n=1 Tax=Fulvivirga marina TaxID=2494733 RepID=A0A937FXM5_9BACT|nr:hypothetical protein [Fulvivirga marina]MBL6446408.1 hypothetical protein [Fulvivirga marina]